MVNQPRSFRTDRLPKSIKSRWPAECGRRIPETIDRLSRSSRAIELRVAFASRPDLWLPVAGRARQVGVDHVELVLGEISVRLTGVVCVVKTRECVPIAGSHHVLPHRWRILTRIRRRRRRYYYIASIVNVVSTENIRQHPATDDSDGKTDYKLLTDTHRNL